MMAVCINRPQCYDTRSQSIYTSYLLFIRKSASLCLPPLLGTSYLSLGREVTYRVLKQLPLLTKVNSLQLQFIVYPSTSPKAGHVQL